MPTKEQLLNEYLLAAMDSGKVEMRKAPGAKKAEEALSTAADFIPFVGAGKSAMQGDYGSAALQAGMDVAGGPLLKGAAALGGKAIPALAGIFIGPKAKTWNKIAAKEFERLEAEGLSNKDAYLKTGTFRGVDGNLRQEISDNRSYIKGKRDVEAKLPSVLFHPELFSAYPELKKTQANLSVNAFGYPEGYFFPEKKRILAYGTNPKETRSVLLHEIQHNIQGLEDWGGGGNPNQTLDELIGGKASDYLKNLQQSRNRLNKEWESLTTRVGGDAANFSPEGQKLISDMSGVEEAISGLMGGGRMPIYERLAGEAEARAVQQRMGYGPEGLREIFPLSSYDVPLDQLIVKRGYKEGGAVIMKEGGGIGKNVGRGMAGLTRSKQDVNPKDVQAMFLDLAASQGMPFAEAGAEYLRGNLEDAKSS
ncbi:hypothetical protein EBZ37_12445, partial [bacterium]|nr:hypothetical protein [bacterium]